MLAVVGCSDGSTTKGDVGGESSDLGSVPDTGPLPDVKTSCAPGDPPVLAVQLEKKDITYVARAFNVGCSEVVRLVGCCGEGEPLVERQESGAWNVSDCVPKPGICCAAMPRCQFLKRGQAIDIPVALEKCPAGVYRVKVAYATECASPNPWDTKTPLIATSNPVAVTR